MATPDNDTKQAIQTRIEPSLVELLKLVKITAAIGVTTANTPSYECTRCGMKEASKW
jgi:hypothetical protein